MEKHMHGGHKLGGVRGVGSASPHKPMFLLETSMQATNSNMILTLEISEACNTVKENRACEEESNMDKLDSLP